ncbi:para-aminobenzoate synthetase component 1 [Flexibacter flexilis DSM 6793]|uniref:Para-aminobenzoate synthetase component 1 n=1 Tax=Flexibacter flexilis DSM 6793 TaxID=927664 RepID=A0A1I1HAF9_9BACT|nr:anthranilate synthase component I family protein [Flexibacter flexilis]SFC18988.1 para-aminobenzoate synthetase component 1 [Flexibacter flexilis DSM 6793]
MQNTFTFSLNKIPDFQTKALLWAQHFDHFSWLTDNDIPYPNRGFNKILAVGATETFSPATHGTCWDKLAQWHGGQWCIGYVGYDLKNETEDLHSQNSDLKGWPNFFFYKPQYLFLFADDGQNVQIFAPQPERIFQHILLQQTHLPQTLPALQWQAQTAELKYLHTVEALQQHILAGDIYEINYCIEFTAQSPQPLQPLAIFQQLNHLSPMPFAALHKQQNRWLLCASPERFIKKQGQNLISQPIKGTAARGKTPEQDEANKHFLRNSPKERAENLMIVDLVRNDLARNALIGSTHVPELFGIYSFRFVHQMISTVAATLRPEVSWAKALADAFPMGSMTGAPKIRAMQLIEQYEDTQRGLFSGAVGYITPEGDFDFNVVIRSLFADTHTQRLNLQVGSAITSDAIGAAEYAECMLKAKAIFSLFQ